MGETTYENSEMTSKRKSSESFPIVTKRKRKDDTTVQKKFEADMPLNVTHRVANGLLYLAPYWTVFKTFTKGRWIGRKITDCFQDELVAYDRKYPLIAIKLGRVLINGSICTDINYRLKDLDSIVHIVHRHEPPVLNTPIEFLENSADLLVVNKPASMPVHPCAQYKVHTVVGMLWNRYGMSGLRLMHRLDRATSGVLIFAKNYETDVKLKEALSKGKFKKEYVCRVEGVFPIEEVVCEQPIGPLSLTTGIQCVNQAKGKSAKSTFRRLWTDGKSSVVLCRIETGRTHQLRVHLQYLGYPILGDSIYNSDAWGPNKGKGADFGKSLEQLIQDVQKAHKFSNWYINVDAEYHIRMERWYEEDVEPEDLSLYGENYISNRPDRDPLCERCHATLKEPTMNHFRMYLHCWKYESDKFKFEAPLPEWAVEPNIDRIC